MAVRSELQDYAIPLIILYIAKCYISDLPIPWKPFHKDHTGPLCLNEEHKISRLGSAPYHGL